MSSVLRRRTDYTPQVGLLAERWREPGCVTFPDLEIEWSFEAAHPHDSGGTAPVLHRSSLLCPKRRGPGHLESVAIERP